MVHLLLLVNCFHLVFLSVGFILTQPLLDYDKYVHQTQAKILPPSKPLQEEDLSSPSVSKSLRIESIGPSGS